MELPFRAKGDQLLPPGELTDIRRRLRTLAPSHDLATVIACAFDRRTRMLPFFFADTRMAPAGVRAIGSALADAGLSKTRIVLQQWNKNFRPSRMQLDGRVPDLFCVSSMSLHMRQAHALLRDARRIDPAHRPLVIAGGSVCVYEPWKVFSTDPADPFSPDVVVTGEEYVFLSLLEVLLNYRGQGESLRAAFARARDEGTLDGVPGLIYGRGGRDGAPAELVDTGIQRLAGDLDELPHPVLGYALLEAPSGRATLASQPLPPNKVRRRSPIGSLVMTFGCKYGCGYCPIPGYNQRNLRFKSGPRIADEMARISREYGIRNFFGADDNFFNDKARVLEIVKCIHEAKDDLGHVRRRVRWGTEATIHDTLALREHLPMMRQAGLRALWLGIEDMTGALVKKGQTVDKTLEAFALLNEIGISPMPMMMHHDAQPFYTRGKPDGLYNQVKLLRKAGAVSLQVLMVTPSAGSKLYEDTFRSGMVYESVAGRPVQDHMYDGNFVIASLAQKPWRKQLNLTLAYLSFYNIFRMIGLMFRRRTPLSRKRIMMQILGIAGLGYTIRRTTGWMFRLMTGRIRRMTRPTYSALPMRSVEGGIASHDLPAMMVPFDTPAPAPAPQPQNA